MKGDFTRFTFNKEKHYSGVYMQQGRVQMDADWNEYVEIQAHRQQTEAKDVIGLCGVPVADDGFKIEELKLTAFLHGVFFVNDSKGWAVGDGGTILATDDGGKSWIFQTSGVDVALHGVFFVNDSKGWAVGDGGTILATENGGKATENGGKSWEPQVSGVDVSLSLYAVFFVDGFNGWAVGDGGTILATENGGKATKDGEKGWEPQKSGVDVSLSLYAIFFVDGAKGWAVGDGGTILATTDKGGEEWAVKTSGVTESLRGVHFHDGQEGCVVGKGTILTTDDGGDKWTPGTLPVNYTISAGRIYVDGILCELEDDATYLNQPDYPNPPALSPPPADGNERTDLVYLDVWQRHITAIENPDIRETALAGPDTATRVKTVWQVKVEEDIVEKDIAAKEEVQNITCETQITGWPPSSSGGCLSTRVSSTDIEENRCLIPHSAGYGGLENQLYRVEIHDGGQPYVWPRPAAVSSIRVTLGVNKCQVTMEDPLDDRPCEPGQMVEVFIFISPETDDQGNPGVLACILEVDESLQTLTLDTDLSDLSGHKELRLRRMASFKWSHDNGSVVFPVQEFVGGQLTNKIKVKGLGRDPVVRLGLGDWVEVSDDDSELKGEPGTLAQIIEPIDETEKELTLSKEISGYSKEAHPKVRRWDQKTETVAVTDGTINLENGVQVLFSGSDFKTGDYWVFPARTSTRQIEKLDDEPPRGIKHHYCRLALVSWKKVDKQWHPSVIDCRPKFPSLAGLTSLTRLFYVGGDGQEAMPNMELPQPLVVGVADGKGPVHGARVRFEITEGGGKLIDGSPGSEEENTKLPIETDTDTDGLAECRWELGGVDENGGEKPPHQQVKACLIDDAGDPKTRLPIYFNANLSVAKQVYYQSSEACSYLKSEKNVQDAIDKLCNRVSRIWPWWIIIVAVFGLLAGISIGMLIGQSQG